MNPKFVHILIQHQILYTRKIKSRKKYNNWKANALSCTECFPSLKKKTEKEHLSNEHRNAWERKWNNLIVVYYTVWKG